MNKHYNDGETALLNEYNLAVLEGYNYAKEGKQFADISSPFYSPERQKGLREGFLQFQYESKKSLNDSINSYCVEPSPESFKKVLDSMDSQSLEGQAVLSQFVSQPQCPLTGLTMEYLLNKLIAEEFQAWYQYFINAKFLQGDERPHVQEIFGKYADDELHDHASSLINRLHDLGYSATYLSGSPCSWSEYAGCAYTDTTVSVSSALEVMVQSEECAINSYTEAVAFAEEQGDVVSYDLFKRILGEEQEHRAELQHFLMDRASFV